MTKRFPWASSRRLCELAPLRLLLLIFGCGFLFIAIPSLFAQAPGTPPPTEVIQSGSLTTEAGEDSKILIEGFYFLDDSGTRVLMPGISFEEIERLQNLEAGVDSPTQLYEIQSLEITGATSQGRAELKVVLRLNIDSTDNRTIAIPLRMKNFHPLGPPDVSGLEDYHLVGSGGDSGHRLMVKTDQRREAVVSMTVAARVEPGPTSSLAFHLPDVPSRVTITTDDEQASGEVVGRGDEVIQTNRAEGKPTEFTVESGGGAFSLRWGRIERSSDSEPLLEIDNSRIVVRWDAPQDQPVVACQMIVRSERGTVGSLRLRLPPNAVLRGTPTIGTNGQSLSIAKSTQSPEGEIIEMEIPEQERQQRVDLNLTVQFSSEEPSASAPLRFRVPEVIGALRQRGEIEVIIGDDYRLRWRSSPWIQGVPTQLADEAGRSYFFRYDRPSFELPIWLVTTRRQLRLSTEAEITLHDSVATIDYRIRSSGRAAQGTLLNVNLGAWRLRSVENLDSSQRIEAIANEDNCEIHLESISGGDPAPIRLIAEHELGESAEQQVAFDLPRLVNIDDTMLIQSATVTAANRGRFWFVVDLEASEHVDRAITAGLTASVNEERPQTHYRVIPPDAAGRLVGRIVQQSPRVSVAGDASIEIESPNLRATLDWVVTSSLDLQGRLPIQIPTTPIADLDESQQKAASDGLKRGASGESASSGGSNAADATDDAPPSVSLPETQSLGGGWTVTVNNEPAVLQKSSDAGTDGYTLVSDQLVDGSMSVRWRLVRPLSVATSLDPVEEIPIPRPVAEDTTFRGTMRVSLIGDLQNELVSADALDSNTMLLDSLPREPIRLRVRSRQKTQQDLFVSKALLRTAVGYATRMEQLIARVQGGQQFRVGLPEGDYEIATEAFVDGKSVSIRREQQSLVLTLPSTNDTSLVDLRVWLPLDTSTLAERIEPALQLPVGVGRIYWEIQSPHDLHVVWASASLGRAMAWRFDRWRLFREPIQPTRTVSRWVGEAELVEVPRGNRYLYLGSDVRAFQAVVVTRTVMWATTASMVLLLSVLLSFVPQTRHPMTVVAVAVLFAGLLVAAPDAAVLAGQLGMISLVLVILMIAIRSLVQARDHSSALTRRPRVLRSEGSSRMSTGSSRSERGGLSATRSMPTHSSRIKKVTQ